jgi:hypothetical protein
MKTIQNRIAMSAIVVALAAAFGAQAAESNTQTRLITDGVSASQPTSNTERQFEIFEHQEQLLDAPSYDPAEHPDAKPAPHSARQTPSVFDSPFNTEELG